MAETPLSRGIKILGWLMILQALGVAVTLILSPTHTEMLFFWQINPQPASPAIWSMTTALAAVAALWLRWLQRLPAGNRSSLAVS